MKFGISKLAIIPIRKEANDRAEIVSQLLFGEHYTVQEELEKWVLIISAKDNYEGWICKKQFFEILNSTFDSISNSSFPICNSLIAKISLNGETTIICRGAVLPFFNNNTITIENDVYQFEGITNNTSNQLISEYALAYQNTPYLWGGCSPFGIDCSGFSQVVYKLFGVNLPRDAYQQAELGEIVSFVEMTQAGDLAFFDNEEGAINHVGIILEPGRIIHASGKVRIDSLDHQGIFNKDENKYSHKLRLIKRIF